MLRKLFARILSSDTDDAVSYARTIERLIDETSLEIFREYKTLLLTEPNIYIVPAVWGAMKEGELTEAQRDIHIKLSPVIQKILELLFHESLTPHQEFAIGYLVRGLFISKIIYMIEFYKNLSRIRGEMAGQIHDLKNIEPWGHA